MTTIMVGKVHNGEREIGAVLHDPDEYWRIDAKRDADMIEALGRAMKESHARHATLTTEKFDVVLYNPDGAGELHEWLTNNESCTETHSIRGGKAS